MKHSQGIFRTVILYGEQKIQAMSLDGMVAISLLFWHVQPEAA